VRRVYYILRNDFDNDCDSKTSKEWKKKEHEVDKQIMENDGGEERTTRRVSTSGIWRRVSR
jgi:hypothetical protein